MGQEDRMWNSKDRERLETATDMLLRAQCCLLVDEAADHRRGVALLLEAQNHLTLLLNKQLMQRL
jgi:hypothetical protein